MSQSHIPSQCKFTPGMSLIRTLFFGPKLFGIEGFHCVVSLSGAVTLETSVEPKN